jgi:hypothetical protein
LAACCLMWICETSSMDPLLPQTPGGDQNRIENSNTQKTGIF